MERQTIDSRQATPVETTSAETTSETGTSGATGRIARAFDSGRLQGAQRQAYIQQLARQRGNQAVQRALQAPQTDMPPAAPLVEQPHTQISRISHPIQRSAIHYEPGEREQSASSAGIVDGTRQNGMQALLANFGAGQATPKPEHIHLIEQMVRIHHLNQTNPGADIFITGYSDAVDTERHNAPLREERAQQIAQQFQQHNTHQSAIGDTQGATPNAYLATNANRNGRARNRGVVVDVMTRNQPHPEPRNHTNVTLDTQDTHPVGDTGLNTSHARFRTSIGGRFRARQDFVVAEPNHDYGYITLKEIRFRGDFDAAISATNTQGNAPGQQANRVPRSTQTPLGQVSTNLYHQGDTSTQSDNAVLGGRVANVTSRPGFSRQSSNEAGATVDLQRSRMITQILDRPVRFTYGFAGQANNRTIGENNVGVGAMSFVVGLDFNGIGGQAQINLIELTERGNVEFLNIDFILGPVSLRLQQNLEPGTFGDRAANETLSGSIIFKCALRKDLLFRQFLERFGPGIANFLRSRGVNVAQQTAVQAGERAAIQAGERAVVQAGERATLQTGERALAQAGERAVVQAGERAVVQAGERAAVQMGERLAIRIGGALLRGTVTFLGVLGMLDLPITMGYWMFSGMAGAFQDDDQFYAVIRRVQRKTFNFCIAFAQVVRGEGSQVGSYGEGTDIGIRTAEQFLERIERENGQEGVQQVMRDFNHEAVRALYAHVLSHYLNNFIEQAWQGIPESTRTPFRRNVLEQYMNDLQPGGTAFNRLVTQAQARESH